ncbi:MAG: DUF58 domain-containing protein [Jiangellaceae bacterium]|nr:DUF58 domain-containing protein [Jiangellaceae bacterium]
MTDVSVQPRWRPSPLAGRLATLGTLAAVAGLLLGRAELVVLAVPALAFLAVGRRAGAGEIGVRATLPAERCLEGDVLDAAIAVDPGPARGGVLLEAPAPSQAWTVAGTLLSLGGQQCTGVLRLTARRWGRHEVGPVQMTAWGPSRLDVATTDVSLGRVGVQPPVAWARRLPIPPRLVQRVGLHAGRTPGAGLEFVGVRQYEPGDVVRRVHWPATARRGRLHLTRHAAEHAADVVVAVDATTDVAGTLEWSARGAAAVAQAYLAAGDRVGVVALGGLVRWLPPGAGRRQLYRVVETVLDVRLDESYVGPDLARLPRIALPPGALVVVFSPLLDPSVSEVLRDLRERGHPTVVVDVLRVDPQPPPAARAGPEAVRLWRLERDALRYELGSIGVTVVPWGDDDDALGLIDRVATRLHPRLTGAVR